MYTVSFFFFFNDPATTEIYTLSLHDALPISIGYRGDYPICIYCGRTQRVGGICRAPRQYSFHNVFIFVDSKKTKWNAPVRNKDVALIVRRDRGRLMEFRF